MTPKEKAEELVVKYASLQITTIGCIESGNPCIIKNVMYKENAKQCALIVVDEIMHHIRWSLAYGYEKQLEYFQEVKNEIEKL